MSGRKGSNPRRHAVGPIGVEYALANTRMCNTTGVNPWSTHARICKHREKLSMGNSGLFNSGLKGRGCVDHKVT